MNTAGEAGEKSYTLERAAGSLRWLVILDDHSVVATFDRKEQATFVMAELNMLKARLARAEALAGYAAFMERALVVITDGHCEDKRAHWLLPYENVVYCECGWRIEFPDDTWASLRPVIQAALTASESGEKSS